MKYFFKITTLSVILSSCLWPILKGQDNFLISDHANDTIFTCDGLFMDSGGRNSYQVNENFTTTICSSDPENSHVLISIIRLRLGLNDNLYFFDGPDVGSKLIAHYTYLENRLSLDIRATIENPSGCITVRFESGSAIELDRRQVDEGLDFSDLGWITQLKCTIECQDIIATLESTDPTVFPIDTGYIDACIGQEISFTGMGLYPQNGQPFSKYVQSDSTSKFEWDFGDGIKAAGRSVTHSYSRSGGYFTQLKITDRKGCTSTNLITQRVRIAPKPEYTFNADTRNPLCTRDTINITLININPVEETFNSGQSLSDTLVLPDGDGTTYTSSIEFSSFAPGQTLTNISDIENIFANMEHTFLLDLDIWIECPDGRMAFLQDYDPNNGQTKYILGVPDPDFFDNPPVPGSGFTYFWNPSSTNGTMTEYAFSNLEFGNTLPSEVDYTPFEPFSSLLGCPLNGDWSIVVRDNIEKDNGFIFFWGINFNPALFPQIEKFEPEIVDFGFETTNTLISQTKESITAVVQSAGVFEQNFFILDEFGCRFDTTFSYDVLPLSHPDCLTCSEDVVRFRDTTICEGAAIQFDATPRDLPSSLRFDFAEFVKRDFGKSNFPRNEELISTIIVNNVFPTQVSNPTQDILSICIDLEIDPGEPFVVEIEAPSGQRMTLVQEGITGNFNNVCFTSAAVRDLGSNTPPFTGEFQPAGSWEDLRNVDVNGEWKLIISSLTGAIEGGKINKWSISFQGRNEITYNWTPAESLSCSDCPDPLATPTNSETYIVEVSDVYGCMYRDTIAVSVDKNVSTLVLNTVETEPATCFNFNTGSAEVFVSGGTGGYTYLWSDSLAQVSAKAVFLNAGNYSVTVTDALGCRIIGEAVVTQPDSIQLITDVTDVLCRGEATGSIALTASGGIAPYNARWSNNATGLSVSNLNAGSYSVTLTDNNGCVAVSRTDITQPANQVVSQIMQTEQGCFGTNTNELTATAEGGTGSAYRFNWSDGQTTAIATGLGTTSYSVTVSDENGCQTVSNFTPQSLSEIQFNIIQSRPTCFGDSDGALGINNLSGGAGSTAADYNIVWSTGQTGDLIENLQGGRTYSVTITDNQGCQSTSERVLDQPPMIALLFETEDASCFGNTDGSAAARGSRGELDEFTFQWDANAGNQTTSFADNLAAGTYSVSISDPRGCSAVQEVTVKEPTTINISFSTLNVRCFGESTGIISTNIQGGIPSYNYAWSNGFTTKDLSNLTAGDYTLTVTDNNGCSTQQSINIEQPEPVDLEISGIDPTCFGDKNGQIQLTAIGGQPPYSYSNDGVKFSNSNVFLGLKAGLYSIQVKDANNCIYRGDIELVNPPKFEISIGDPNYTILLGDSIELDAFTVNAQGEVSYTWSAPYEGTLSCDDCPTTVAKPFYSLTYQLTGIDELGCEASDLVQIFVQKIKAIDVPTGFTPNNDGNNDLLLVHGRPGTKVSSFKIFNRWGELLYETGDFDVNDPDKGWDGNFRGKPSSSDTYIWYLEVEFIDGTREAYKGQTNLIR